MDFSAWNWATSFRVHEAACLIAGVMPISKRQPTSEELPPQARPILVKLMAAYVEWILQKKNPDRPKSIFLEGCPNDDGTPPEINSLAELPGSLVSREAINRFLSEIEGELGLKSAYDFGSIRKTADPLSMDGQRLIKATPTPVEAPAAPATDTAAPAPVVQATETKEQRQDRRLKACIDDGLPMDTKAALSRLPDGVGDVAGREGVTRQAFSTDVKAALKRRDNARREGKAVHCA